MRVNIPYMDPMGYEASNMDSNQLGMWEKSIETIAPLPGPWVLLNGILKWFRQASFNTDLSKILVGFVIEWIF